MHWILSHSEIKHATFPHIFHFYGAKCYAHLNQYTILHSESQTVQEVRCETKYIWLICQPLFIIRNSLSQLYLNSRRYDMSTSDLQSYQWSIFTLLFLVKGYIYTHFIRWSTSSNASLALLWATTNLLYTGHNSLLFFLPD